MQSMPIELVIGVFSLLDGRGDWCNRLPADKESPYLSQLLHSVLAYSVLFEHDLRCVDDVVHRLLEDAALQWMSSFSNSRCTRIGSQ